MEFWGDEVTPSNFIKKLNALGAVTEIEVHIFTNGGDEFASLAIYNELARRSETVSVYIDGVAASGGTVISCAGDMVYMPETAMMFIHNPLIDAYIVNADDARKLAGELDKAREPMIAAYMKKTSRTREEVIALMDGADGKGTWLTAAEAIEFGMADDYTPEVKLPIQAAAMISPGVYNYRGYRIDFTRFDKAAEKTAGIINYTRGGSTMAKQKPKVAVPKKTPRTEITFVEIVCPSCGGAVNINPETGEVFSGAANNSEPQAPAPANGKPANGQAPGNGTAPNAKLARRMPSNFRAQLFDVPCPHCGEHFAWDTDAQADGEEGTGVQQTVPLGTDGAGKPGEAAAPKPGVAPAPANAPANVAAANAQTNPKAELAQSICPSCGAQFQFETEQAETGTDAAGTEGYILTCPECASQYVEPLAAAEPTAIPAGATAQAAFQMGVRAERERMLALEEMAAAAPGVETMIAAAKRTGASATTMSRNVFRALAKNPNIKAAQFVQAIRRDNEASGVNALLLPQHHDKQASFTDNVFEKLNNR
jgi:ATP-dependent protease ClpP protease subunit/endogenous inhibitor of DNA gyrase (YacG/DUF329 family)